jgi:hypothetical protein
VFRAVLGRVNVWGDKAARFATSPVVVRDRGIVWVVWGRVKRAARHSTSHHCCVWRVAAGDRDQFVGTVDGARDILGFDRTR